MPYSLHDVNFFHYGLNGALLDVSMNAYVDVCCWVRQFQYFWYSKTSGSLATHKCKFLTDTMYITVVHGLIFGRTYSNNIIIHQLDIGKCITIPLWLDYMYNRVTTIYIYLNILFIGTKNSYLLAYRLNSLDDFRKLKKENLLLEIKLNIGHITKIDIIEGDNLQAIIIVSESNIFWHKIK